MRYERINDDNKCMHIIKPIDVIVFFFSILFFQYIYQLTPNTYTNFSIVYFFITIICCCCCCWYLCMFYNLLLIKYHCGCCSCCLYWCVRIESRKNLENKHTSYNKFCSHWNVESLKYRVCFCLVGFVVGVSFWNLCFERHMTIIIMIRIIINFKHG